MQLDLCLEFECKNNVAEYETFVQGLILAMDMNFKCLKVFGDSQIVTKQVRNSIYCTSHQLKNYQKEVWNLMSKFEAFNIKCIPPTKKIDVDMLANAASNLGPSDDFTHDIFSLELIYRPSNWENVTNFWIFDDDQKIIYLLHSEDTFKASMIDDEQHKTIL